MSKSDKQNLTKFIQDLEDRSDGRPNTSGPVPHTQQSQFPEVESHTDSLFQYVMKFEGVVNGKSHIGDGGERAFFIEKATNSGFGNPRFIIDNEFGHIHRHGSLSLHIALPHDIGVALEKKNWTEQHPLGKLGRIPNTNFMLFGARNERELEVSQNILHISYLWASNKWQ
ncbi:hypothetical protein AKO1_007025 [Acrasis kona]|uniref:Luciferase domain-containing protein n=1 Tax=Acrasis kona TaxID=1008807 RepID=A0AAW2YUA1_9EUKA